MTSSTADGASSGAPIPNPATALPEAGVLATPVIDLANKIVYVVGGCQTNSPVVQHWYLHGLNLTDGSDAFSAIDVGAGVYVPSYGGAAGASTNCGSAGTTPCLLFNAEYQVQRVALTLTTTNTSGGTGEIYVAFAVNNASENEWNTSAGSNPYHGWLIGYPIGSGGTISTTQANFAFASTPNFDGTSSSPCTDVTSSGTGQTNGNNENNCGLGGGIWMSGEHPLFTRTRAVTTIL